MNRVLGRVVLAVAGGACLALIGRSAAIRFLEAGEARGFWRQVPEEVLQAEPLGEELRVPGPGVRDAAGSVWALAERGRELSEAADAAVPREAVRASGVGADGELGVRRAVAGPAEGPAAAAVVGDGGRGGRTDLGLASIEDRGQPPAATPTACVPSPGGAGWGTSYADRGGSSAVGLYPALAPMAVPEAGSLVLLVVGGMGLMAIGRRQGGGGWGCWASGR
jgi:hypothetical protein